MATDPSIATHIAFFGFALLAVFTGWRVFRTDSMVRASFLLLASFLDVGAILLLLTAPYLGVALLFMMSVEMMVMAIFMVAFMMNPAGLNPMNMVHQPRLSILAGLAVFAGGVAVALLGAFPNAPVPEGLERTRSLGTFLMGDGMLVFETAGVTLLAAIIGSVILSSAASRHGGRSDEGSLPPSLHPDHEVYPAGVLADGASSHGHNGHNGHGGHGGHGGRGRDHDAGGEDTEGGAGR